MCVYREREREKEREREREREREIHRILEVFVKRENLNKRFR